MPPAAAEKHKFTAPAVQGLVGPPTSRLLTLLCKKSVWLRTVKTEMSSNPYVNACYGLSSMLISRKFPPGAMNAQLPLFVENAQLMAMIKHSMAIVKSAIQDLNPG